MSGRGLPRGSGTHFRGSESLDRRVRAAAEEFVSAQHAARRRLYRMHLQASVTTINRMALEAAAVGGIGPAEVAARLEPPAEWPWRSLGGRSAAASWWAAADLMRHGSAGTTVSLYYSKGRAGVVRRDTLPVPDDLRFGVDGGCIGVVGSLGAGHLYTRGGSATLEVPDELPHTVVAALPGRIVGDLFEHPLLDGRPYVIGSAGSTAWGLLRIEFQTGVERLSLPWAGLLRDARRG